MGLHTSVRAACVLLVLTCLAAPAGAQVDIGTQYVSFWRGDFRIIATQPQTRVTILDIEDGSPVNPAFYIGNFPTNPFVLADVGDSFEGNSGFATLRVRVVAEDDSGAGEPKPVVVWTGDLNEATLKHPATVPADQNAWASYIPDVTQPGAAGGGELGTDFLGFTSRDVRIIVQKGVDPVRVTIDDLATNVETDTDDTLVLDRTSPFLQYEDAEIEVYSYSGFEDDTIRVTTNAPASVLAGIFSADWPDWATSPPSYGPDEHGRELGTLFWTYVPQWLTVFPVFENTTLTITDLSDGDDSWTVLLPAGGFFSVDLDVYCSDPVGDNGGAIPVIPRTDFPNVTISEPPGGAFEDDLVKVEADRPVTLYVGPPAWNIREFADVAYSVPVSVSQRLVHVYAQNGGARDLQLISFGADNVVQLRSAWYTEGTGVAEEFHHDASFASMGDYTGGNALTDDWYWSSGAWSGEMLRVTAVNPVQVMGGDYDGPNFGCYIPFIPSDPTSPPIADAGPDLTTCPDTPIELDASNSQDRDLVPGTETITWEWDLDVNTDSDGNTVPDDDVDDTGETIVVAFPVGTWTVQLTYTDDDGETTTDLVTVTVEDLQPPVFDCPRSFQYTATDFLGGPGTPVLDATDDCDPSPVVTNDRTSGGKDASDFYPCGVTGVTWTAMDAQGNSTACTAAIVIQPEGGFPSIGDDALRVTKNALGRPRLDWSLATGLDPDTLFLVIGAEDARTTREAGPVSPEIPAQVWTDPLADGRLHFYDVRYVKCDGTTGGN